MDKAIKVKKLVKARLLRLRYVVVGFFSILSTVVFADHTEVDINAGFKVLDERVRVTVICSNQTTQGLNYLAYLQAAGSEKWTCVDPVKPYLVAASEGDIIEHRILGLSNGQTPKIEIIEAIVDPISVKCENRTSGTKVNATANPANGAEWSCDGLNLGQDDYLRIKIVGTYSTVP